MIGAIKKIHARKVAFHAMMCLLTLAMIFPFLWMISSSLKFDAQVLTVPIQWIPSPVNWNNYVRVITEVPFFRYLSNTAFVAVLGTALQVVFSSLAGYAFAKLPFRGRNLVFMFFIATMIMPWHSIMIPQYILMSRLGFTDSYYVLILMQVFSAFGIFLMRQFFLGLPDALREAAKIDGAGELRTFFQIMLPHAMPGIAALSIFCFIGQWNDYISPLVYINSPSKYTLQLGLRYFEGQYTAQYGVLMAGTVCALLPILLVYLVFEEKITEGIVFTSMKN